MYLVYLDDSSDNKDFQIILAVIVPEQIFCGVEGYLSHLVDTLVPEQSREKFEFHASKMFHSQGEFSSLNRDTVLSIFSKCATIVQSERHGVEIVYGAVDMRSLRASHFATANPADIAFRLCLEGLEKRLESVNPKEQIGILICDDTEKQHIKKNMQQAYRAYRKRYKKLGVGSDIDSLPRLHDDLYFGDSAYSVGLQVADMCAFIVLRHLEGMQDTEFIYEQISKKIFYSAIEPAGDGVRQLRKYDAEIDEGLARRNQVEAQAGTNPEEKAAEGEGT